MWQARTNSGEGRRNDAQRRKSPRVGNFARSQASVTVSSRQVKNYENFEITKRKEQGNAHSRQSVLSSMIDLLFDCVA